MLAVMAVFFNVTNSAGDPTMTSIAAVKDLLLNPSRHVDSR